MGDTSYLLQIANLAVTGVGVLYLMKVEHRFTKLETYVQVLLRRAGLSR